MLSDYIQRKYIDDKTLASLRSRLMHQRPFPHLLLSDFFKEPFIRQIAKALAQQEFVYQESDLFSFSQTKDLSLLHDPDLTALYRLLNSWEFKEYVRKITDIEVLGAIDCSGFVYRMKDYLLPHDDHLETRRVAYTLHLSKPDFSRRDGGALELFDNGKVVVSYPPHFNTLILFPVQEEKTLHQVSEVMTDRERFSLAGWFHDH